MDESNLHQEATELVNWALKRAHVDFSREFPLRSDLSDAEHETWHHERADLYLKAFEITRRNWS